MFTHTAPANRTITAHSSTRPTISGGRGPAIARRGLRAATLAMLCVAPLLATNPGSAAHAAGPADMINPGYTPPPFNFSATASQRYSGTVATFTDALVSDLPADFTVTSINWGDGSAPTRGGVSGASGYFGATGTHTYDAQGRYPIAVTLTYHGATIGLAGTANVAANRSASACYNPGAASSSYDQTVLRDTPAGYWRLNDWCNGLVVDRSGNDIEGSSHGGILPLQGGVSQPGMDGTPATGFDGSNAFISLGDPAALQPAKLSVEAWINATNVPSSGEMILRKRYYGYALYLNGNGRPAFNINDRQATVYAATGPSSLADGRWHHLVGTYDGTQVCLYVDGHSAGTCTTAAPIYYQQDLIAIGRDGGYSGAYFAGTIADVAIYPAALSAQRVQAHYQAAATNPTGGL